MAFATVPMLLSGSTDGRNIKVVATSTPGTTIHTSVTGTSQFDEISLDAVNSDTTARKLTIEFGGTTSPDDLVEVTIPPESGPVPVVVRWRLQNATVVKAFAAAANVVLINGRVNRVTPS